MLQPQLPTVAGTDTKKFNRTPDMAVEALKRYPCAVPVAVALTLPLTLGLTLALTLGLTPTLSPTVTPTLTLTLTLTFTLTGARRPTTLSSWAASVRTKSARRSRCCSRRPRS